jgi:hypothetical protein
MPLTFLALENPLGLLGTKIQGEINAEAQLLPLANLKKKDTDAATFKIGNFTKLGKPEKDQYKYYNRYAHMEEADKTSKAEDIKILPTFVVDAFENRATVLEVLNNRGLYPDVRLAMCSSLTSTWKYIQSYINANLGAVFDTLILYGHGNPGSINMGTSKFAIGPALDSKHTGHANRKRGREIFGLDKPRTGEPLRVAASTPPLKEILSLMPVRCGATGAPTRDARLSLDNSRIRFSFYGYCFALPTF